MTTPINKLLILIKRRPGMSVGEFRDYYENQHSKLGDDIGVKVGVVHYMRRLRSGEPSTSIAELKWGDNIA